MTDQHCLNCGRMIELDGSRVTPPPVCTAWLAGLAVGSRCPSWTPLPLSSPPALSPPAFRGYVAVTIRELRQ